MHIVAGAVDEIARERDLIYAERWGRIPLSVFAMCLTAMYLPLWIVGFSILGNVLSDSIGMHYMRALSPSRHPWRYRLVMALHFLREAFCAFAAALTWHHPENYGQPLAVGIVMAQLLQLATARSIHLPFGHAGLMGVLFPAFILNTTYWLDVEKNIVGLAISTTAMVAALAYAMIAMHSNHRMHQLSYADRNAALAADRAKSRFLAQMSHELRTPLNAILGMGHAEMRRNRDTLSQTRLSVLVASAEGLSTILDDILDMSAVEAGRLPIRPRAVIPRDELRDTLALFQPGIADAGLVLRQDIDPSLEHGVKLDPQRLRQCLSNLLSNALKNTSMGSINVAARLDEEEKAEPLLRIDVSDTGPGIPNDLHDAIFEPFSQRRTLPPAGNSNGLGLSICRAMARHMGGDLRLARNQPGAAGAHFILTLRVGRLSPGEQASLSAPSKAVKPAEMAPMHATAAVAAGLRVLVVDDIATNRLVASTYLRMLGASMIESGSGTQALQVIAETPPDLVLLDMNMPGMDGLETLRRIRELPGPAGQIPVIAMTADALEGHRTKYLSSGLDGYLAKPINPERIAAEIKAVLDKRAAARSDSPT